MDCTNYNPETGQCKATKKICLFGEWPNGELCEALFGRVPDATTRRVK